MQTGKPAPRPTVTALRRPTGRLTEQLTAAVSELLSEGIHVQAVGPGKVMLVDDPGLTPGDIDSRTVELVRSGEAHGIAVTLGVDSLTPTGDGLGALVLAVDTTPTLTDREWQSRWSSVLDAAQASGGWGRLEAGWVLTTPGGDTRHVFKVTAPDSRDYLTLLLDDLARVPDRHRAPVRLLTARAVVDPSGGDLDPAGGSYRRVTPGSGPTRMANLSVRELHSLVEAVRSVGTDPSELPLDDETRMVMAAYRRQATDSTTAAVLEEHGWVRDGTAPDGAPRYTYGKGRLSLGGPHRAVGSVWVDRPAGQLTAGWHSSWATRELLTGLDTVDLASALLADGVVSPPPLALFAANRSAIEVGRTPTDQQTQRLLAALAEARHPTVDMPMMLVHAPDSKTPRLLSTTPALRSVRHWEQADRAAHAVAEAYRATKSGSVVAPWPRVVPEAAVADLLGAATDPAFPARVDLVASRPVLLRADDVHGEPSGVALAKPGWHPAVHTLMLHSGDWSGYQVPAEPTREQAQDRLDRIVDHILHDFPFATDADKARAVCYLLTCAGRELMSTSPVWMVPANQPGSGKGLLLTCGRMVANGTDRRPVMSAYAGRDEENEKRLASEILAHMGDVHFAHVDEMRAGDSITSLLFSELATTQDGAACLRKLGKNQEVTVEKLIITVSGNNITPGGDFARRVLPIRLLWEGDCRPEERKSFRHKNLPGWVRRNRSAILAACHTILLRGLQGSTPATHESIGSFEEWCDAILRSLTDLTIPLTDNPDKSETVAALASGDLSQWKAENDTTLSEWGAFFRWWIDAFGADALQVSALLNGIEQYETGEVSPPEVVPAAVINRLEGRGHSRPGKEAGLGTALSGMVGNAVMVDDIGRVRLQAVKIKGAKRYRLVPLDPGLELKSALCGDGVPF